MHDLKNINWAKGTVMIGGSLLVDIAASLVAGANLKILLIHLGVVFGTTGGAFLLDAAKKMKD